MLGWEDPQKEMATHSTILAWGNPMDREAWPATVQTGVVRAGYDLATKPPPWDTLSHSISVFAGGDWANHYHMPCGQRKQNIKQKQYCNKFSTFKNGPHQKKKKSLKKSIKKPKTHYVEVISPSTSECDLWR